MEPQEKCRSSGALRAAFGPLCAVSETLDVLVLAGGSPQARMTSPPVELGWPEPLTCGASLWEIKFKENKFN